MYSLSEVKAEFLLNTLYPEMKDRWEVYCDGTFYRNYNADVMSIFKELDEVHISRDSIVSLLPKGMLGGETLLLGQDVSGKWEHLHRRLEILKEVFRPFDSMFFRQSLSIEKEVSDMLENRLNIILNTLFDIDLTKETNPLIKTFSKLLPFVEMVRGDYATQSSILSAAVSFPVEVLKRSYSYEDSTCNFVPWLTYRIKTDGLDQESYEAFYAQVKPLEPFIKEWFVTFDTYLTIEIDGVAEHDLFDYNINLE